VSEKSSILKDKSFEFALLVVRLYKALVETSAIWDNP